MIFLKTFPQNLPGIGDDHESRPVDFQHQFLQIHNLLLGNHAVQHAFGTAGVKILSSKDAKKVYTNCTAAVLRAKDSVMKTVNTVQENAGDILADAKAINEERAAKEAEEFEDVKEDAEEAEESEK